VVLTPRSNTCLGPRSSPTTASSSPTPRCSPVCLQQHVARWTCLVLVTLSVKEITPLILVFDRILVDLSAKSTKFGPNWPISKKPGTVDFTDFWRNEPISLTLITPHVSRSLCTVRATAVIHLIYTCVISVS
jgi:hypothetical protein